MPLLLNVEYVVISVIEIVHDATNAVQSDDPVISVTFLSMRDKVSLFIALDRVTRQKPVVQWSPDQDFPFEIGDEYEWTCQDVVHVPYLVVK